MIRIAFLTLNQAVKIDRGTAVYEAQRNTSSDCQIARKMTPAEQMEVM